MKSGIRIRALVCGCVAVVLPCLALAGPPANTDMARGEIEGIIQFCIESDPGHAQDLEKEMTLLTNTLSPAGTRGTAAYQQGHDLVTDALVKLPKSQAVSSCALITGAAQEPRKRDDDRRGDHRGR